MKDIMIIVFLLAVFVPVAAQNNNCNNSQIKNHKRNTVHFVQFGIMSKIHKEFEKKYGIAVQYENCVVSKYLSEKAKQNNILVAKKLTQKFGNAWKKDLGFLPYGL